MQKGSKITEEHRQKISNALRREKNPAWGTHWTRKRRIAFSKHMRELFATPEFQLKWKSRRWPDHVKGAGDANKEQTPATSN